MIITHTKVSTIADGGDTNLIRASDWNANHAIESDLRGCFVHSSTIQSIPNAVLTPLNFDTEIYDTDSIHSTSTPSRMTIPAGVTKTRFNGAVQITANSSGNRYIQLYRNGSAVIPAVQSFLAGAITHSRLNLVSPVILCTSADYYELCVYQDCGSSLNTINDGILMPWFAMEIVT